MNEPATDPTGSNSTTLPTTAGLRSRLIARLYTSESGVRARSGPRPSIPFLIVLNGLIFFALGAIGSHTLGILFHVPVTVFFMVLSLIPQGIVKLALERRFYLKPTPRFFAYLSPLWLLVLSGLVLPAATRPPNKQNPAPSPDGRYQARFSSPDGGWNIVIADRQSKTQWKEETPFLPHLQIYWRWDADNRLWIYNSDDGRVHYLKTSRDGWQLTEWSGNLGAPPAPAAAPNPPRELYPPYATPPQ